MNKNEAQKKADRTRYLIMPALVRVSYYGSYTSAQARESSLRGYVELLISEINVPHHLHKQTKKGPHYQVSLSTGKRYEPWIADIVGGPPQ